MRHLPLFADLTGRRCVVIGGGHVATKRVELLMSAGAAVTVIAPALETEELRLLAADGRVEHVAALFADQPLTPYWLVVAATDDRGVNARAARAAADAQRFCNVVDDPELCSFVMPAIVDREPVTIAIGSGGHSPVLSRWIKGVIETVLPQRLGALAALAGRWRERVRERLPALEDRRRFWQEVMTGDVASFSHAGDEAAADAALDAQLEAWTRDAQAKRTGEAWLVGAGPGDPGLLTLRGRELLATADVVLYDRLVNPEILKFARREAELVSVGKTPRRPSITQKQLNRLLVRLVESGKRVCRLKGGDPMIFGRVGEELEALVAAGLRFQIVPGVSAAEGCAAYSGIPLTLRGVAQTVVLTTGHTEDDEAASLEFFRPGQTLALYMGVAQYATLGKALIAQGHAPATPVAIVENGTTARQRVIRATLATLATAQVELDVHPPALLFIGETTRFAQRYAWFAPSTLHELAESGNDVEERAQRVL